MADLAPLLVTSTRSMTRESRLGESGESLDHPHHLEEGLCPVADRVRSKELLLEQETPLIPSLRTGSMSLFRQESECAPLAGRTRSTMRGVVCQEARTRGRVKLFRPASTPPTVTMSLPVYSRLGSQTPTQTPRIRPVCPLDFKTAELVARERPMCLPMGSKWRTCYVLLTTLLLMPGTAFTQQLGPTRRSVYDNDVSTAGVKFLLGHQKPVRVYSNATTVKFKTNFKTDAVTAVHTLVTGAAAALVEYLEPDQCHLMFVSLSKSECVHRYGVKEMVIRRFSELWVELTRRFPYIQDPYEEDSLALLNVEPITAADYFIRSGKQVICGEGGYASQMRVVGQVHYNGTLQPCRDRYFVDNDHIHNLIARYKLWAKPKVRRDVLARAEIPEFTSPNPYYTFVARNFRKRRQVEDDLRCQDFDYKGAFYLPERPPPPLSKLQLRFWRCYEQIAIRERWGLRLPFRNGTRAAPDSVYSVGDGTRRKRSTCWGFLVAVSCPDIANSDKTRDALKALSNTVDIEEHQMHGLMEAVAGHNVVLGSINDALKVYNASFTNLVQTVDTLGKYVAGLDRDIHHRFLSLEAGRALEQFASAIFDYHERLLTTRGQLRAALTIASSSGVQLVMSAAVHNLLRVAPETVYVSDVREVDEEVYASLTFIDTVTNEFNAATPTTLDVCHHGYLYTAVLPSRVLCSADHCYDFSVHPDCEERQDAYLCRSTIPLSQVSTKLVSYFNPACDVSPRSLSGDFVYFPAVAKFVCGGVTTKVSPGTVVRVGCGAVLISGAFEHTFKCHSGNIDDRCVVITAFSALAGNGVGIVFDGSDVLFPAYSKAVLGETDDEKYDYSALNSALGGLTSSDRSLGAHVDDLLTAVAHLNQSAPGMKEDVNKLLGISRDYERLIKVLRADVDNHNLTIGTTVSDQRRLQQLVATLNTTSDDQLLAEMRQLNLTALSGIHQKVTELERIKSNISLIENDLRSKTAQLSGYVHAAQFARLVGVSPPFLNLANVTKELNHATLNLTAQINEIQSQIQVVDLKNVSEIINSTSNTIAKVASLEDNFEQSRRIFYRRINNLGVAVTSSFPGWLGWVTFALVLLQHALVVLPKFVRSPFGYRR
uniref:Uncharacterized protein n=1 Tax=Frankliniella occidentalis associated negev-like virus 1 TaxID=2767262 RepID=A0A7G9IR71_9VIRU|nr:hypothetical protein [Frankliniella occidentalis associated negev-like virus 1]